MLWQQVLEYFWIDDVTELVINGVALTLAFALALPIGWERERAADSAGMRTFAIVSMVSCGFMLIALDTFAAEEPRARVMYGVISGIGFIGGGAILKETGRVHGTATAASLWAAAGIGMACAWGRLDIAVIVAVATVLTLYEMTALKSRVRRQREQLERNRDGNP